MVDHLFADSDLAALYDPLHPPKDRSDFAFYLPMIMSANAVLDVGCGTGALLHQARSEGHRGRLCGLDPAPGMLEQARRRTDIEWVLGDLATARWDGAFDLIVMTGHAFQALVEDHALRASLAAIRSALTADGCFAFETRNPLARDWETWTPDEIFEAAEGTDRVRMTRRIEKPFDGETFSFTHTFTHPGWEHPKTSHSTLRFLGAAPLAMFLEEAGLAVVDQFGDWDRNPLADHSPEIITLARPRPE